jgi:hypothetical protein
VFGRRPLGTSAEISAPLRFSLHFSQTLQTNVGIIPQISPRQLRSTSFPINYSLNHPTIQRYIVWERDHLTASLNTPKNNKKFWEEVITYLPRYDMDRIKNGASNNSSIFACVFVAALTYLPSRCLSTIWGYTYRHKDWWEIIIEYAVLMGSDAKVYVPNYVKSRSSIRKLIGGYKVTQTEWWSKKPTFIVPK